MSAVQISCNIDNAEMVAGISLLQKKWSGCLNNNLTKTLIIIARPSVAAELTAHRSKLHVLSMATPWSEKEQRPDSGRRFPVKQKYIASFGKHKDRLYPCSLEGSIWKWSISFMELAESVICWLWRGPVKISEDGSSLRHCCMRFGGLGRNYRP